MAQLLYQFQGPQGLAPDILPWLGLTAVGPNTPITNRWSLVQPYLYLCISLVLQRFARRARNDWHNQQQDAELYPEVRLKTQQQQTTINNNNNNLMDSHLPYAHCFVYQQQPSLQNGKPNDLPPKRNKLFLFIYPEEFYPERTFTAFDFTNAAKWYLSNLLEINSYQVLFFRHLWVIC